MKKTAFIKTISVFSVLALVLIVGVPLITSEASSNGELVIDTINGNSPSEHCLAGPLTFVVHGITGSQGGPYSIDIGDGLAPTTTVSVVSGKDTPFSNVVINYIPARESNTTLLYLYHGGATGNDSHLTELFLCVAAPTDGVLTVVKNVVGDALPSDFDLHVKQDGTDVDGSPFSGSTFGEDLILGPGTYVVSEDPVSSYDISFFGDCSTQDGIVTIEAGGNYTCTVTNTFNPVPPPPPPPPPPSTGTLTLVKVLPNNNGGTATEGDFAVYINQVLSSWGLHELTAGLYNVFENTLPGYTPSVWEGACNVDGDITIVA
ncbi:MAG: hypothetical protein AAB861_02610 [Patescibacteria group bacterium]